MRRCVTTMLLLAGAATALAQSPAPDTSRGRLLYENHCIECHSTQMHWRDKRLATNWESLRAWVRQWQQQALLGWTDDDITDVTRHLNRSIYRFREPGGA